MVIVALGGVGLGLTGCSMHRMAESPAPMVNVAQFTFSTPPDAVAESDAAWWRSFGSEELDTLVERALSRNLDIETARTRVAQAAQVVSRTRAGTLPVIGLTMRGEHDIERDPVRDDLRQLGVSLDWEPDLFGRQQAQRQQRRMELAGQLYRWEGVRFGIAATVVDTYFGIVEQQLLLGLLAEQKRTAEAVLALIEMRYREGLISQLDVLQQRGQLTEIMSLVPVAEAARRDLELQLDVLVGRGPTAEGNNWPSLQKFPALTALMPVQTPVELVSRRPDLRAARADMMAADADIGRAMAERLPRLTLDGDLLLIDGRATNGNNVTTVGLSLVQPLLDWGARRAEWDRTKAVWQERLATFSETYLEAVAEVETTVYAEGRQRALLTLLEERRDILKTTLEQASRRYDAGLTDYLAVLSVTQQLYAVEQRLIREKRRLMSVRIAQYRAIGGTMPVAEPSLEPTATMG